AISRTPSNNAADFIIGGGVDNPVKSHLAIRAGQGDYFFARFGNKFTFGKNNQSNLPVQGGIKVRFLRRLLGQGDASRAPGLWCSRLKLTRGVSVRRIARPRSRARQEKRSSGSRGKRMIQPWTFVMQRAGNGITL